MVDIQTSVGPELKDHADARDEVVLWDQTRVWIYTPDRPFSGSSLYRPTRNPHYNDSNYRSTVSLPLAPGGR